MNLENLFILEDKILGQCGLYAMWTVLYVTNLIVLTEDDTKGPSRDFNIIANGLSVLYCGAAGANMIFGNRLPSSMMLTIGPIHQYLFWLLFVYYGPGDVLGSHPIGVYNWITIFIVGIFSFDMVMKTWLLSYQPDKYKKYIVKSIKNRMKSSPEIKETDELRNIRVNNDSIQNVVARFHFKDGKLDEFNNMLKNPETGISLTKKSEGFIDIDLLQDTEDSNILILVQKWRTKENHMAYVQKRKDMGMFDQLTEMLQSKPEILYVNSLI